MTYIDIRGLEDLQRALDHLGNGMEDDLGPALGRAASIVVSAARPHVPVRTGRAAASMHVEVNSTEAFVKAGGREAPYYPWLDFGGRVGRRNSVKRLRRKSGRYLFPALKANREEIARVAEQEVVNVVRKAGLG